MKNLLSAFLLMLLILHAPGASYAQSAVPAVAKTQTAEPEKIAALNEAARHNAKMLELFRAWPNAYWRSGKGCYRPMTIASDMRSLTLPRSG
jgi:hypothetical protein